ncbi:hypothetical protein FJZ31_35265 [Candidatus Poribacteria bacterium]|nr:hypothetical protein [Candidatus Poribacteria bacterium]
MLLFGLLGMVISHCRKNK